jgi:hypothetical protein
VNIRILLNVLVFIIIQFSKFSNWRCYGTGTMKEVGLRLMVQNFTMFETHGYSTYKSFSGWADGRRTGGNRFRGRNMGLQELIKSI